MIEQFVEVLNDVYGDKQPTAREYAEALWLALQLSNLPAQTPTETPLHTKGIFPETSPKVTSEPSGSDLLPSVSKLQGFQDIYSISPTSTAPLRQSITGRIFRSPSATALPGAFGMAQSLRPLKRKVPSKCMFVLDEDATSEYVADGGGWSPIMRPLLTRWLDLALIVDTSASMAIWEESVKEFCMLLEQEGAFRDIRVWGLMTDTQEDECIFHIGMKRSSQPERLSPDLLLDPTGRRLFMVVSDCVSTGWHNGAVGRQLAKWGRTGPTAIVQVLPQRLWERTGLGSISITVAAPTAGVPNTHLRVKQLFDDEESDDNSFPVPVVMLERKSLGRWARMIVGASEACVAGVMINTSETTVGPDTEAETNILSPEQRLQQFRSAASPTAQKLAGYLATITGSFNLPLIRLLQRAVLPESDQLHLAEVLLGGLLCRVPDASNETSTSTFYEFIPGVCDLLINNVLISDVFKVRAAVHEKIAEFIEDRYGRSLDFPTIIEDSEASTDLPISSGGKSFAAVPESLLRRIGWPYEPISKWAASVVSNAQESKQGVYPEFQPSDLSDPNRLIGELRDSAHPISTYLRHLLLPEEQHQIDIHNDEQPSKSLMNVLIRILNHAVHSTEIYQMRSLDDIDLTYPVRRQTGRDLKGEKLTRLNRLLLESAFPLAIAASPHVYCLAEDTSNCQAMENVKRGFEQANRMMIDFEKVELDELDRKSDLLLMRGAPKYDIVLQHSYKLDLYVRNNWVLPLDELKQLVPHADYSFEEFIFQNVWKESSYYPKHIGGQPAPVGYPFAANTMLLVYNQGMFDDRKYQLSYQEKFGEELRVPTDWRQFLQIAEFFTSKEESTFGLVMQGKEQGKWLYYEWCNFIYSMGGAVMQKHYGWEGGRETPILVDSEETKRACEFYFSLKPFNAGDYFDIGHAEQQRIMLGGNVAMAIMWSDRLFNFIKEPSMYSFGFAPIPGNVSMIGAGTYFTNRYAKNKLQAAQYIVSMMQRDNQVKLMLMGLCSAVSTTYDHSQVKSIPYVDAVQRSLKRGIYMLEAAKDAIDIRDIVTAAIQKIWRGDVGLEKGLKEAHRQIRDAQEELWT